MAAMVAMPQRGDAGRSSVSVVPATEGESMTATAWTEKARKIGAELAEYAARHDQDGSFVEESFLALKEDGAFKALVPEDLGGGGAGFRDICEFIRELGRHCGSTALTFSMHTHLVAATLWKHRKGQPGEALLRKIAGKDLILVSTGAGDWLDSNGTLERTEGGYRYTSKKFFASGCPVADVMVTSGRYEDPSDGPQVLHFALPLEAKGVRIGDDWDTHGMRGTGSHTVHIDGAFVPDEAVSMRRARGPWHPAFSVVSTVAMPIFMSAYVGIAERAAELALERVRAGERRSDPGVQYLAGELENDLFVVRAVWNAHVDNAAELDFTPDLDRASRSVQAKTVLGESCVRVVDKAMELAGGFSFFRRGELERLMRDARAAPYHPLQPKRQHLFSGRIALGMDPL